MRRREGDGEDVGGDEFDLVWLVWLVWLSGLCWRLARTLAKTSWDARVRLNLDKMEGMDIYWCGEKMD